MPLLAGVLVSLAMMGAPFAFQMNVAAPPTNLQGWLVFAITLGGFLSLVSVLLTKLVINPAIQTSMKGLIGREEFTAHLATDEKFQNNVNGFIEYYYQHNDGDERRAARRKGDPR